jgi:hypothetical protein
MTKRWSDGRNLPLDISMSGYNCNLQYLGPTRSISPGKVIEIVTSLRKLTIRPLTATPIVAIRPSRAVTGNDKLCWVGEAFSIRGKLLEPKMGNWILSDCCTFTYKCTSRKSEWIQTLTLLPAPLSSLILEYGGDSFEDWQGDSSWVLTKPDLDSGQTMKNAITELLFQTFEPILKCEEVDAIAGHLEKVNLSNIQFSLELPTFPSFTGYGFSTDLVSCVPDCAVVANDNSIWRISYTFIFVGRREVYGFRNLHGTSNVRIHNALLSIIGPQRGYDWALQWNAIRFVRPGVVTLGGLVSRAGSTWYFGG